MKIENIDSNLIEKQYPECPNCKESNVVCACLRNKCLTCGNPVGNTTFTICDKCWDNNINKEDNNREEIQEETKNNNKLQIKSAGIINGQYKVILSNDMELDYISEMKIERGAKSFGKLLLEISLPAFNEEKYEK